MFFSGSGWMRVIIYVVMHVYPWYPQKGGGWLFFCGGVQKFRAGSVEVRIRLYCKIRGDTGATGAIVGRGSGAQGPDGCATRARPKWRALAKRRGGALLGATSGTFGHAIPTRCFN